MAITISTFPASGASVGVHYSSAFVATGGVAPYTWVIAAGSLPTGLTLNASTGAVAGTPTVGGVFTFLVLVTDSVADSFNAVSGIQVSADPLPPTLVVPVALHTFEGDRVYISSRTPAAPGLASWSVAKICFDQAVTPDFLGGGLAITSASLGIDAINNRGIIYQCSPASPPLSQSVATFLGNGLPDTPIPLTCGTLDPLDFTIMDFWDISNSWFYNGAYYYFSRGDVSHRNFMVKSTDNGVTWTEMDAGNAPPYRPYPGVLGYCIGQSGTKVDVFCQTTVGTAPNTEWALNTFDFATDTWSGPYGNMVIPSIDVRAAGVLSSNFNLLTNYINRFPNGDIGVFYNYSPSLEISAKYRLYASGSWGPPIDVTDPTDRTDQNMANVIVDPSGELLHVFTYHLAIADPLGGRGHPRYSTVTHSGTVTRDIFVFPTYPGFGTDGVGHCMILDDFLLVPYDHKDIETNSVWVAPLSTGQFVEELLPHPAQEINKVVGIVPNNLGTGYAEGDTGFPIGGGGTGLAYVIQTVDVFGAVVGLAPVPTFSGYGYSLATNLPTVNAGLQPGSGSGLTVDITTIEDSEISCAYMIYGNPIGFPPPPIGTCPIVINAGPSGSGPCSSPGTNPALDSYIELRKVLVAWKKETHLPVRGKS